MFVVLKERLGDDFTQNISKFWRQHEQHYTLQDYVAFAIACIYKKNILQFLELYGIAVRN